MKMSVLASTGSTNRKLPCGQVGSQHSPAVVIDPFQFKDGAIMGDFKFSLRPKSTRLIAVTDKINLFLYQLGFVSVPLFGQGQRFVRLISLWPPSSAAFMSFLPPKISRYHTCGVPGVNIWMARANSILSVSSPRGTEIRCIDLVIGNLFTIRAVKIFNQAAPADNQVDQAFQYHHHPAGPSHQEQGCRHGSPAWSPFDNSGRELP